MGWVVLCMLMCMRSELCWLVAAMYIVVAILSMADIRSVLSVCRNYGVHEQHWVCMYGMLGFVIL